jgi:cytoskeletal protein CcmA (bactofilin family)
LLSLFGEVPRLSGALKAAEARPGATMKLAYRLLLPTLLLGASAALAQETPLPSSEASAATPAKVLDVSFRGTLRDALQRIAEEGRLNVMATGELDTPVELHLQGVTAEQALRTLARTYALHLEQEGSIFTLRPLTAGERGAPSAVSLAPPPVPPIPLISADDFNPRELQERVRVEVRKAQRRHKGARDVVARGQSLEVKEGDSVDDAVVYGGNLVVKGHVEGDAVAFGGNLEIHGVVEGDAHVFGGNVVLHPGAAVQGDVSALGGRVIREDGARVAGSTESFGGAQVGTLVANEVKKSLAKGRQAHEAERRRHDGGGIPGFLLRFAALFGLGFLGQLFFPARMKELAAEITSQPVQSGLTGLLGFLALIPITVVLAITLVGIPIVVAMWLVVPVVAALSLTVLAGEIGLRVPVLRGRKTQAVVLALGLLILLAVGAIPGIGPLVLALASAVAFGAVIRTRFGNRPRGIPEPVMSTSV